MQRREFITLVGGAAVAWPMTARAQQATKLPTIGFLGASTHSDNAWATAFAERLRELGWIEGRTVVIEYRWAEGRDERYAQIAEEFVRLKVDVIVTPGGAALTVKQATSGMIPLVFAVISDPIAGGLVASLARPGGNATGLSLQTTDTAAKRLELMRELVPGLRRLAIFFNASSPQPVLEMHQVQKEASAIGLEVSTLEIARAEEIVPAFQGLGSRADFLYVCGESGSDQHLGSCRAPADHVWFS